MSANWSNPTTTSTYTNFVTETKERDTDNAALLDPALVTPTNLPTNAYRFNSAQKRFEKTTNGGGAWSDMLSAYAFPAGSVAAPAIYMGGDTGTGLYRIGANNIAVTINGTKLIDMAAGAFAVTGTLSASGAATVDTASGTGVKFFQNQMACSYSLDTDATYWINYTGYNGGITRSRILNIGDGKNNLIAAISSTGLAVTGTLSATGLSTLSGGLQLDAGSSDTWFDNSSSAYIFRTGGGAGDFNSEAGHLALQPRTSTGTPRNVIIGAGSGTASAVATISSAGLAVTGTIKATTGAAVGGAAAGTGGLAFPATAVAVADANTLDDYDEYTAASTACTGAITTACVWKLTKIGNTVTLKIPAVTGAGVAISAFTLGLALPEKYRPAANFAAISIPLVNGGTQQSAPGMLLIVAATGVMQITLNGTAAGNFTATSTAGIGYDTSISWVI